MIARDSIETAYSFLHQKRNVYIHSLLDWQKDDIEYAIACYADDMNQELYEAISGGKADFLRDHKRFTEDITQAVERLEEILEEVQSFSYSFYFQRNFIISAQRVVGFLLLKSCLMALANTSALPLPFFWVYCWAPITMVSEPCMRLMRSITSSRRRIF